MDVKQLILELLNIAEMDNEVILETPCDGEWEVCGVIKDDDKVRLEVE